MLVERMQMAETGHGDLSDEDLAHDLMVLCEEELNPREQAVIHLRFVWQMSIRQINQLLELENRSGARTHLTTAMRKLRRAVPIRFGTSVLDSSPSKE